MTLPRYCYDKTPVQGFTALCERFSGKALQSPWRSTVPLLSLVEHSRPQWHALLESWGASIDSTVHFEYCVASPKLGANPSQTDALFLSDSTVWAIEAKWTEPRYETVAKRVGKAEADGADPRKSVGGWLRYLQPFASRALHLDDFGDVVYQVLHRTALACAVAAANGTQPQLIYLHFHPSPLKNSATSDQYASDLGVLHALLGRPAEVKFLMVEMPLAPTAAFDAIKDLDKRSPATSVRVSEALRLGPLFSFGPPTTTRI